MRQKWELSRAEKSKIKKEGKEEDDNGGKIGLRAAFFLVPKAFNAPPPFNEKKLLGSVRSVFKLYRVFFKMEFAYYRICL